MQSLIHAELRRASSRVVPFLLGLAVLGVPLPARAGTPLQTPTSTSLTASAERSDPGESVTLTATVSPAPADATSTDLVRFLDGATEIGTAPVDALTGVAELAVSTLSEGTRSLTAAFPGTAGFEASDSSASPVAHTVRTTTTTELVAAPGTVVEGASVTLTATVTGTDAGTVAFSDDLGTALGGDVLDAGVAEVSTADLAPGVRKVTATFQATDSAISSSDDAEVVVQLATTTTLSGTPDPSDPGESVLFTATVSPAPTDSGQVRFTWGSEPADQDTVDLAGDGTAQLPLTPPPASVTAEFLGTQLSAGSTSDAYAHAVRTATTTTITSNRMTGGVSKSNPGQSVTLTAVVIPAPPDGTPIAFRGSTEPAFRRDVALVGGRASATVPAAILASGTYNFRATLATTETHVGSRSDSLPHTVRWATTTTVTSSLSPSESGQAITLTAAVPGAPGGRVSFRRVTSGTTCTSPHRVLGTVNVVSGRATLSVSSLTIGTQQLCARYLGGPDHLVSNSALVSQQVIADTSVRVVAGSLGVEYAAFYPVTDGYRDTVGIRGTLLESATVRIQIYTPGGAQIVNTSLGTRNGAYEYRWNGRNGTRIRNEGRFRIRQVLTDVGGHVRYSTSYVTLDHGKLTFTTKTVELMGRRFAGFEENGGSVWPDEECFGPRYCVELDGGIFDESAHVYYHFTLPAAAWYRDLRFEVVGGAVALEGEVFGPATISLHNWQTGARDGARKTGTATGVHAISMPGDGHVSSSRVVRGYVDALGDDETWFIVQRVRLTYTYGVWE